MYTYVTDVCPGANHDPDDECVCTRSVVFPEASVTSGSCHVTIDPNDPDSTVIDMSDGQPRISGAFVSTEHETVKMLIVINRSMKH